MTVETILERQRRGKVPFYESNSPSEFSIANQNQVGRTTLGSDN